MAETSILVNLILFISLAASSAAILYWAGTIDNDIENNPESNK